MLTGLYFFFAATWVAFLLRAFYGVSHLRTTAELVADLPASAQTKPASVSLIIATKDNGPELTGTLTRLASFRNPGLEVIVVNDRSTDDTAARLTAFAARETRFKIVTVNHLPPGWLGKVYALHQGSAHATGDYLLFMDADITISETLLARAVQICGGMELDHLAILPRVEAKGFWLGVLIATSEILFTLSARPWLSITRRPVECVKGVGSFNFLRRSFFATTAGFTWLKMEVADDVALAQLIASSGGRSLFAKTDPRRPEASFSWYGSVGEMVRGLEKNTVGGFTNYKPWRVVAMVGGSLAAVGIPVSAPFVLPQPVGAPLVVGFLLTTAFFALAFRRHLDRPFVTLVSLPLGVACLGLILLRSAVRCFVRGGITWSGTFYPLEELRAGVRVRLGF